MRTSVIFDLVKEEWVDQRRVISGYFLGSVLLFLVLAIWSQQGLKNLLQQLHNGDLGKTMSIMAFIVILLPYFILWLFLTSRPNREFVAGIYPFLHILPLTQKEIVTSRYVSRLIIQGVATIWLCVLLWLFHRFVSIPIEVEVRATLFIFPCLTLAFTAVQLGLFYCWGMKGEGVSYILWTPIVLIVFFTEMDDKVITQLTHWYTAFPVFTVGLCLLVVVLIWSVSWLWSMRYYDKYDVLDS